MGTSLVPSDLNRTPLWASLQLRLNVYSACSTYHYLTIPLLIAIQNAPQHCQSVTHHHLGEHVPHVVSRSLHLSESYSEHSGLPRYTFPAYYADKHADGRPFCPQG